MRRLIVAVCVDVEVRIRADERASEREGETGLPETRTEPERGQRKEAGGRHRAGRTSDEFTKATRVLPLHKV